MSLSKPQPVLLADAAPGDFAREIRRRVEDWLAALPDGKRWTGMDWVFASVVGLLALLSTGFFTATYSVFQNDPDYFFQRFASSLETGGLDRIETGAITQGGEGEGGEGVDSSAMPAPVVHRATALQPNDYEIVMIFSDEAFLATARELMRARVGSILPGLGAVTSIDADAGEVRFEKATLKAVAPN